MKQIKLIVVALMSFLSISCEHDTEIELELNAVKYDQSTQRMIDKLASINGYEISQITADEDYLYYTDLIFPKEKFWETYGNANQEVSGKHYRGNLVTAVSIIRVNVYSVVPTPWQTAINQAMAAWNGLNLSKKFVGVSSDTPIADGINITMGNVNGTSVLKDNIAGANPPINGYPGHLIVIDNAYATSLTPNEKLNIMAHELGHSIGFLHTDGVQGTLINTGYSPCQNSTDVNSVMRSINHPWYGFSTCDVLAFDAVY